MGDQDQASVELQQYPDPVVRVSYPPLPRRMGNPNAVASEAVLGSVLARRQADRAREGMADDTTTLLSTPPPTDPALLDDPETQAYVNAGWL